MSLWTPYAEDTALDLSKRIKVEPYSNYNVPEYNGREHIEVIETTPRYVNTVPQEYTYQQLYPGPISPISSGSSSAFEFYNTTPLSPPESPISQPSKRPYSLIDADYLSDDPDFQAFERDALRAMAEKNGGALLGNNPRMRRTVRTSNDVSDDSYRRQRERNNFAAKQSRDRRKLREIHLALKVTYLKKEVAALRTRLSGRVCVRCQQMCRC